MVDFNVKCWRQLEGEMILVFEKLPLSNDKTLMKKIILE